MTQTPPQSSGITSKESKALRRQPEASQKSEGAPPESPNIDLTTPGDSPEAQPVRVPTRGRRYRVLGKGEGDYCVYQVIPPGGELPEGCMVPIPEVPRFKTSYEAMRWVKGWSGDRLIGKELMVFRALRVFKVQPAAKPQIEIIEKPPILINDGETEVIDG